ncbi:MAG: hypothetical protein AAFQ82_03880, partial [Myxococcota bacterium]
MSLELGDPLFRFEGSPVTVDDVPDSSWGSVEDARRALIDRSIGYRSGDDIIERDYLLYRDSDGRIRAAGFADDARVLRPGALDALALGDGREPVGLVTLTGARSLEAVGPRGLDQINRMTLENMMVRAGMDQGEARTLLARGVTSGRATEVDCRYQQPLRRVLMTQVIEGSKVKPPATTST